MSFHEHDDEGELYYLSDPINENNINEYKEYLRRYPEKFPFYIYLSVEMDDKEPDKNEESLFMIQYYMENNKKIIFWRGFIE